MPIRPVVNWRHSPGAKLATFLSNLLKNTIPLPYAFNVKNTETLINELNTLPVHENIKICSFDIGNMYTNIPQQELKSIIYNELAKNSTEKLNTTEIMHIVETILSQNYFQHNNTIYKQQDGLAMGAPTSAILSEIFIQHLECNDILNTLIKHNVIDYHRYVDDMLIVYNEKQTNINQLLLDFNKIHKKLQYTMEAQTGNRLNFLDVTISIIDSKFTFDIYRKPTTTDHIIHNTSCHPNEHKLAGIRYLVNRLHKYPITPHNKQKESLIINTILLNNGYNNITHTEHDILHKNTNTTNREQTSECKKWITFTYTGKETRMITRLLKDYNVKIAYKTNNTISDHLRHKNGKPDKYESSGIYELRCKSCPRKYIGQTGRNFKTRYREHMLAIRNNNSAASKYNIF
jgi:hypothetical protein